MREWVRRCAAAAAGVLECKEEKKVETKDTHTHTRRGKGNGGKVEEGREGFSLKGRVHSARPLTSFLPTKKASRRGAASAPRTNAALVRHGRCATVRCRGHQAPRRELDPGGRPVGDGEGGQGRPAALGESPRAGPRARPLHRGRGRGPRRPARPPRQRLGHHRGVPARPHGQRVQKPVQHGHPAPGPAAGAARGGRGGRPRTPPPACGRPVPAPTTCDAHPGWPALTHAGGRGGRPGDGDHPTA